MGQETKGTNSEAAGSREVTASADVRIRTADLTDKPAVEALLRLNNLSATSILAPHTLYLIAENGGGEPVGAVGLELGTSCGLLRSATVHPQYQGKGIGTVLTTELLSAAATAGLRVIYLFSTGAGAFWRKLHFNNVPVQEIVSELPESHQVREYVQKDLLQSEVAWRLNLRREAG